ncbi:MAG TPA: endonuclease MutS2 [Deltaproteobacteria bacterium]|nr:endonuclease MutS2 [Deltaproteobacteria bacterium]
MTLTAHPTAALVDEATLEALEYGLVLEAVASHASSVQAASSIRDLRPMADPAAMEEAYASVAELSALLDAGGRLPLGGLRDVRGPLSRCVPEGACLPPEELLDIRYTLETAVGLRAVVDADFRGLCPRAAALIGTLSDQRDLLRRLDGAVDEKGGVKDTASRRLLSIRGEIRRTMERSRSLIAEMARSERCRDALADDLYSVRDDRYVLMVKAGPHASFPGVVHGRSASGLTYFIEPMQMVELNNRLAILRRDESAEVMRILRELTAAVAAVKSEIEADIAVMVELDRLQAKALFGRAVDGVVPVLRTDGSVSLRGARHPLLVFREAEGKGRAVPIDMELEPHVAVLVISGANTGGKTVSLKTLGLLTLLAQSAVPVPAAPGSALSVFGRLWADIGDRQSIVSDLSTFSAHLRRTARILDGAGPSTLVLIDEIGVGTDPAEGSALALSVLEELASRGAKTVVTTHLNLLKAHAQTDPAFENCAVLFDEEAMRPLYALRRGVPGPSLGLAVALKYGLPQEVVERAKERLAGGEGAFVESVRLLEEEKERVARLEARLRELEARRSEAVERFRRERRRLVERLRRRLEQDAERARTEIRRVTEELRGTATRGEAERASKLVRRALGSFAPAPEGRDERSYRPRPGDWVEVTGTGRRGEVTAVDDGARRADVAVGGLKVRLAWSRLKKVAAPAAPVRPSGAAVLAGDAAAAMTLNIIGKRVDEALALVRGFVEKAHMVGLERVEIIHGVGTGALARAVRAFLKESPVVKGASPGNPDRGGAGVTVVALK